MIVYDSRRRHGFDVLLHVSGSALYSYSALPMAILSGVLSVVLSTVEVATNFLAERIQNPSAYFGGISFIVGFVVVYRAQLAIQRYSTAQTAYFAMESKLLDFATLTTAFIDRTVSKEADRVYTTLMRWVTLFHELASEDIQGFEFSLRVPRIYLTTNEAIILEKEKDNKTVLVMSWILDLASSAKHCFTVAPPIQTRLFQVFSDAHMHFNEARRIAETPFPFPFAQITVAMITMWAFLTPITVSVFFPGTYILSFLTSFTSTWMLFAVNEASSQLESPFDDADNDLPVLYYSVSFQDAISALKYSNRPSMDQKSEKKVVRFSTEKPDLLREQDHETYGTEGSTMASVIQGESKAASSSPSLFEVFDIKEGKTDRDERQRLTLRPEDIGHITQIPDDFRSERPLHQGEVADDSALPRPKSSLDVRLEILDQLEGEELRRSKSERPFYEGLFADDAVLDEMRAKSLRKSNLGSPRTTPRPEECCLNLERNSNTVSGIDGRSMAAQLRLEREKFQRQLAFQAHQNYRERRSYRKMKRKDIRRIRHSQRIEDVKSFFSFRKAMEGSKKKKVRESPKHQAQAKSNLSNLRNKGIFRRFR